MQQVKPAIGESDGIATAKPMICGITPMTRDIYQYYHLFQMITSDLN